MVVKSQLKISQVFSKNSFILVFFLLLSLMPMPMNLHQTFDYLHYFKKLSDLHLFSSLKKCIFIIFPNQLSDYYEAYLAYSIYFDLHSVLI